MTDATFAGYVLLADAGSTSDFERFWARRADTPAPLPVRLSRLRLEIEAAAEAREALARETSLARNLDHEGLVRVIDGGEGDGGRPYVAHEVVDGVSLDELLGTLAQTQHLLPAGVLTEIALRLAEALAHVHAASGPAGRQLMLTHNGLSGATVWATRQGAIKLDGFRLPGGAIPGRGLGPVGYVAPEVVAGARPDPRADLYALGVLLGEMATGRQLRTLTPDALVEALPNLLAGRADLPGRFPLLVSELCRPDPSERPQLARMLAQQLSQLLSRVPDHTGLAAYLAPGVNHIRPAAGHPPAQLLAEARAAGVSYPPRPDREAEIVSIAPSGHDRLSVGPTPRTPTPAAAPRPSAPGPAGERLRLPLPTASNPGAKIPEPEAPSPLLGFDAQTTPGQASAGPWKASAPGNIPTWLMLTMALLSVIGAIALARVLFVGGDDDAPVRKTGLGLTGGGQKRSKSGETQVRVTSDPPGALVYIDGETTDETTPAVLPAKVGYDTTVSITLDRHRDPSPKSFVLERPGEEAQIHFRLTPLYYLRVTSEPSGAEVRIDGRQSVEKTPMALPPLARGETAAVHVDKPGFMPQDLEIYAGTRTPTVTHLVLEPAVTYAFESTPDKALVQIDGTRIGRTPIEAHPVQTGRRFTVRIARPDAKPFEKTLVAKGEGTQTVRARLRLRPLSALDLESEERAEFKRISKIYSKAARERRQARAVLKKAKLRLRSFEHRREINIDELERVKDQVSKVADTAAGKDAAYERAQAELDDLRRRVIERLEVEQGI